MTIHNLSRTKEYKIWTAMKQRCYNTKEKYYHRYGGRGISVCDKWINNAEAYILYIRSLDGYGMKGYSVDRIDNNKDYEAGNLKWSSPQEQSSNKGKKPSSSSLYKGVSFKANRWVSRIQYNGKEIYLGRHKKEVDAAIAYNNYIEENHLSQYPLNRILNVK